MIDDILGDAARSGLFHIEARQQPELSGRASAAGLRLRTVDLSTCATGTECLRAIGDTLSFPEWYGSNFDALVDCLCDPDWQSASGDLVLLVGIERLEHADRESTDTLLAALSAASADCRDHGQALWIVIDRPVPGVPPLPDA